MGTEHFTPRGRNIYISVGILFILLPTRSRERGVLLLGCPQVGGSAPGISHLGGEYIYKCGNFIILLPTRSRERGV